MKAVTVTPPAPGFFKNNRGDLTFALRSSGQFAHSGFILLKGPVLQDIYDDDIQFPLIPENTLYHLTGVADEDTYALISIADSSCVIYVKLQDPAKSYWLKVKGLEEFKAIYEIDDAKSFEHLKADLVSKVGKNTIYLNVGVNKYSGITSLNPLPELEAMKTEFSIDKDSLYEFICESRVHKNAEEIRLLSQAAEVAMNSHLATWKKLKAGLTERQVSNFFSCSNLTQCNALTAYHNICGCGHNGSYLHYEDRDVPLKAEDLILIDAGVRVHGYCSDITRTVPVGGKFSEKQKQIYNIVLAAQEAVFRAVKPGLSWQDAHIIAEKTILQGLLDLKLIKGELEDLWKRRTSYYFFPHGLGHYIGLYTHDLAGLKSKENVWVPYEKMNLRVHRILEENMVLTNEPGIYFNEGLLNLARKDEKVKDVIDFDAVAQFAKEIGGIRIEDMFSVTNAGAKILSSRLPKTVMEIEAAMADKVIYE